MLHDDADRAVADLHLAAERLAATGTGTGLSGEIVAAIAAFLRTGQAAGPVTPDHAVLDALRRELIRTWADQPEAPDSRHMLQVLQAVEGVRASDTTDASPGNFADQLAAPDGLDLVVEVSHDLRSPVTAILFLAETLLQGRSGPVTELQRRQLGLVYSAALALSELTGNMLEMARGGSQLADESSTSFSITEIIESVLDITRPMAEEKGLLLRFHSPGRDHRMGQPAALSRVLLNLTTNALKFTHDGMVEIVVREVGGTRVEFSVRDTGPGINQAALDTLYAPFRPKQDGSGFHFSGTGLGLALCRRLTGAMEAELCIDSKRGWGTRFYFELDLPLVERG